MIVVSSTQPSSSGSSRTTTNSTPSSTHRSGTTSSSMVGGTSSLKDSHHSLPSSDHQHHRHEKQRQQHRQGHHSYEPQRQQLHHAQPPPPLLQPTKQPPPPPRYLQNPPPSSVTLASGGNTVAILSPPFGPLHMRRNMIGGLNDTPSPCNAIPQTHRYTDVDMPGDWFLSREYFIHSPSRRKGVTWVQEQQSISRASVFLEVVVSTLQKVCQASSRNFDLHPVYVTAHTYLHRFFAYMSLTDHPVLDVALAALWLASKRYESHLKVRELIQAAHNAFSDTPVEISEASLEYLGPRQKMISLEFEILKIFDFQFMVPYPHERLQAFCEANSIAPAVRLLSLELLTESCRCPLSSQYPVNVLCIGAIYLAIKLINCGKIDASGDTICERAMDSLESEPKNLVFPHDWMDQCGCDLAEIHDVSSQVLELYTVNPKVVLPNHPTFYISRTEASLEEAFLSCVKQLVEEEAQRSGSTSLASSQYSCNSPLSLSPSLPLRDSKEVLNDVSQSLHPHKNRRTGSPDRPLPVPPADGRGRTRSPCKSRKPSSRRNSESRSSSRSSSSSSQSISTTSRSRSRSYTRSSPVRSQKSLSQYRATSIASRKPRSNPNHRYARSRSRSVSRSRSHSYSRSRSRSRPRQQNSYSRNVHRRGSFTGRRPAVEPRQSYSSYERKPREQEARNSHSHAPHRRY